MSYQDRFIADADDITITSADAAKALPEPYEDSAWIGFYLNTHDALALEDERLEDMGECEDRLHMTLAMTRALSYEERAELNGKLNHIAIKHHPLTVNVAGLTTFDLPDSDCLVVEVEMTSTLMDLRHDIEDACKGLLNERHGFMPHITLCYLPKGTDTSMIEAPKLNMQLPVMTLAESTRNWNFSLGYGFVGVQDWVDAVEDEEDLSEEEEELAEEVDDILPAKAIPFFDFVGQEAYGWTGENKEYFEGTITAIKRFGEYEGLKATKENPVIFVDDKPVPAKDILIPMGDEANEEDE